MRSISGRFERWVALVVVRRLADQLGLALRARERGNGRLHAELRVALRIPGLGAETGTPKQPGGLILSEGPLVHEGR
jgi:hypothetical protein